MIRVRDIAILTIVAGVGSLLGMAFAPPARTQIPPERTSAVSLVVARGIIDVDGGLIQLAASREGIVQEVHVEEGAIVRKGDTLLVVDDRAARVQFDVDKAQLQEATSAILTTKLRIRIAERELNRLEPVVKRHAASAKSFDEASDRLQEARAELAQQEAAIATAEARLASSALEIEQRAVRAPVDGTIVRRLVQPGDGISTLTVTPLFWLAPAVPPVVRAEIEELVTTRVASGQEVEIVVEGEETQRFAGQVQRVGRAFGPRRVTAYDSRQRTDVRVVECIISLNDPLPDLVLGQRVIVRIRPSPAA